MAKLMKRVKFDVSRDDKEIVIGSYGLGKLDEQESKELIKYIKEMKFVKNR